MEVSRSAARELLGEEALAALQPRVTKPEKRSSTSSAWITIYGGSFSPVGI